MFTTMAGRIAAQSQAGDLFSDPPEAFELAAPAVTAAARPAGNPIGAATKHGATFEQRGADWACSSPVKRGRTLPMVVFSDPDQAEAARMFLAYFHFKE
jgi:hypothetical protein